MGRRRWARKSIYQLYTNPADGSSSSRASQLLNTNSTRCVWQVQRKPGGFPLTSHVLLLGRLFCSGLIHRQLVLHQTFLPLGTSRPVPPASLPAWLLSPLSTASLANFGKGWPWVSFYVATSDPVRTDCYLGCSRIRNKPKCERRLQICKKYGWKTRTHSRGNLTMTL